MAELVNLRAERKLRSRAKKRAEADANAAKFGRSKTERELQKARDDKARSDLDAHRRDTE